MKKDIIKMIGNKRYWFKKSFDLVHGFGYFCQICDHDNFNIGFGFDKNKFSCVRKAKADLFKQRRRK